MSLIEGLFDVSGKTVVVTGGSRGIGYMIARGFVEGGATVVIFGPERPKPVTKPREELSEFGTCISHPADLSTDEGVESLAAKVAEISPTLDVLVNNAGATWGAPVDDFPAAGFDKIFDINVNAIFLLTQKLLPQLRSAATAEDPARVINIGSIDGLVVSGSENFSYGASKAAVHMLTRKLAATLAGEQDHGQCHCAGPVPVEDDGIPPRGRTECKGCGGLGPVGQGRNSPGMLQVLPSSWLHVPGLI